MVPLECNDGGGSSRRNAGHLEGEEPKQIIPSSCPGSGSDGGTCVIRVGELTFTVGQHGFINIKRDKSNLVNNFDG